MPRQARGECVNPDEVQVLHLVNRCVRRAFLCGDDPMSGHSFEHRREWIRDRLEFLASVFSIDCLTYAILSNHLHLVLRSRPDVAKVWSDREVARRWWRLFPKRRESDGSPAEPEDHELAMITADTQRLREIRRRLSDVSWWMRCTAENIARRSNAEDRCSGRFWEGRFRAQVLLDETSLLACAAYIDLNAVRAAIAKTPEDSKFTGAKDRLDDVKQRAAGLAKHNLENNGSVNNGSVNNGSVNNGSVKHPFAKTHDWERTRARLRSGWMSPLEIDELHDPVGPDLSPVGRRASLKGFLSMSLAAYLELLDWTGRQLRARSRGAIPGHLAPLLERLGVDAESWCDVVQNFGKLFKRAAGRAESIAQESARRGLRYMHAPGAPLLSKASG